MFGTNASGEYGQPEVTLALSSCSREDFIKIRQMMEKIGWHNHSSGHDGDKVDFFFRLNHWHDACKVCLIDYERPAYETNPNSPAVFEGTYKACREYADANYNDAAEYKIFDFVGRQVTFCNDPK